MATTSPARRRAALRFVVLIGILSFFADFVYEGSRSSLGPYLAALGARATLIGVIIGGGELLGYAVRLLSGRWADATGAIWPITLFGYAVQMTAVPALALTHTWPQAAVLIILERVGKAIRNPPRDVMLAQAGGEMGGYGWAFGLHEALDQFGALLGPVIVALILARGGNYHQAFATLAIPAVINLALVLLARTLYPQTRPHRESDRGELQARMPGIFWVYLLGAGLVAAGFADYPLIAYHFAHTHLVPNQWIAIFYSVAMAVSGMGSLVFGRLFDRHGFRVLVVLTVVSAAFAPLVFLGNFWAALLGTAIWGLGMGVHESIIPAAVAPMVRADRRASAFGLFTAGYGISWFFGSAAIGFLYDRSLTAALVFCVASQLAALPAFLFVARRNDRGSREPV